MKTRIAIVMIIALPVLQFVYAFDKQDAKGQVREMVAWAQNRDANPLSYPRINSEEALEKVILFVNDPLKYSDLPHAMDGYQLWNYIYLYDSFLFQTKKSKVEFFFFQQLDTLTKTMNDEKVMLVTTLFINCHGALYCEGLCGYYTELFGRYPALFVKDLKKRNDWKRIIGDLAPGDYEAMKAGLAKLGDSKFERELKEFWVECEKRWRGMMKKLP